MRGNIPRTGLTLQTLYVFRSNFGAALSPLTNQASTGRFASFHERATLDDSGHAAVTEENCHSVHSHRLGRRCSQCLTLLSRSDQLTHRQQRTGDTCYREQRKDLVTQNITCKVSPCCQLCSFASIHEDWSRQGPCQSDRDKMTFSFLFGKLIFTLVSDPCH